MDLCLAAWILWRASLYCFLAQTMALPADKSLLRRNSLEVVLASSAPEDFYFLSPDLSSYFFSSSTWTGDDSGV
jgi:hypothetical protein